MSNVLPEPVKSPRHYDVVSATLHWTVAVLALLFIFATPVGEPGADSGTMQARAMDARFTIGLLILVLMCPRLLWRLAHPAPTFPATVDADERLWSTVAHWAFYMALFAMGLLGVAQGIVAPFAVQLFGVWQMPVLALPNEGLYTMLLGVSSLLNGLVLFLLVAHMGAALYHAFVVKDAVLRSMLPWGR